MNKEYSTQLQILYAKYIKILASKFKKQFEQMKMYAQMREFEQLGNSISIYEDLALHAPREIMDLINQIQTQTTKWKAQLENIPTKMKLYDYDTLSCEQVIAIHNQPIHDEILRTKRKIFIKYFNCFQSFLKDKGIIVNLIGDEPQFETGNHFLNRSGNGVFIISPKIIFERAKKDSGLDLCAEIDIMNKGIQYFHNVIKNKIDYNVASLEDLSYINDLLKRLKSYVKIYGLEMQGKYSIKVLQACEERLSTITKQQCFNDAKNFIALYESKYQSKLESSIESLRFPHNNATAVEFYNRTTNDPSTNIHTNPELMPNDQNKPDINYSVINANLLFADKVDGFSPDDVKQGNIGDCYLLSTISSIVKADSTAISNMIKDNGDGTFDVTLYIPKDRSQPNPNYRDGSTALSKTTIKVTAEFPQKNNKNIYADAGDSGEIWVQILEKAVAQSFGGYDNIGDKSRKNLGAKNIIEILTGGTANIHDLSKELRDPKFFENLDWLLKNKKICTFQTKSNPGSVEITFPFGTNREGEIVLPSGRKLYLEHGYSLESVDVSAQVVTLRNPHNNSAIDGGVLITLSLAELETYFSCFISNH